MQLPLIASLVLTAIAAPTQEKLVRIPVSRKVQSKLTPLQIAQRGIAQIYTKYGVPAPSFAGTDAPLVNGNNFLYVCNVTIGNGQVLPLDLDTGSADTWVRGLGCQSTDGSCDAKLPHVDASDKTLKDLGQSTSVSYGSGSVTLEIYNAPVSIGGLTATYPIGISTKETGFSDGFEAGLLGLGYNQISQIGSKVNKNANYFDNLGFTGDKNVFSFYFSNYEDGDNGELTLGGIDSTKYTGDITYVPLNSQTYFQFSLSNWKYTVGSKSASLSGNAIADTGTTLLLFNSASVANAINQAIGAGSYDSKQGIYPIDCAIAKTGAPVTLSYNGVPFSVPASVYVVDNGDGTCFSGISQFTQFGVPSIFGDVFLRQFYSIYDKNQNRVGFATAKHPKGPTTTTTTTTTAVPTTTKTTTTVVPTTTKATTTVVPTTTTTTTTTVKTTTTTTTTTKTTTTATPTPTGTTCAHDKCVTGGTLNSSCDPCVAQINQNDFWCRFFQWNANCVAQVKSVCGLTC